MATHYEQVNEAAHAVLDRWETSAGINLNDLAQLVAAEHGLDHLEVRSRVMYLSDSRGMERAERAAYAGF